MSEKSPKILIDAPALREILIALSGPIHLIRELQVIQRLPGIDDPITIVAKDFDVGVKKLNE